MRPDFAWNDIVQDTLTWKITRTVSSEEIRREQMVWHYSPFPYEYEVSTKSLDHGRSECHCSVL